MKVTAVHDRKMQFRIQARQHVLLSDQPVENGGEDEGMTPPELFLASLASCAAFYAAQYLAIRNLASGGIEVEVEADKLRDPARLGNLRLHVKSPVSLNADQHLGMERAVHRCLIHQTLLQPLSISIHLEMPVSR
ncbi:MULTISPECIES: OsmC family protein [Acidobacterium]|uniref:OsmC family protein n=1 Tax=Acidobacterium capsulatum (strain ATCC 51196 / DSM 11244 / BCRC 80197 / JCM 7670 / NBRC 15755 / NCIMB 13165 / 161) TaxID=240015 RepID=C1F601_ACIC5|nr:MULTISPECIES: OsmC family protein [Acidobacterium]ACO33427.1 OsmC family protein [Acidobacterium capsulatum ATCC 51196]HCT60421.1 OsmC family peroxiredoxin [Acidobacterium sp.]